METIFKEDVVMHLEATLQDFKGCTDNINLSEILDKAKWKWSASGRFVAKECYQFLSNGGIFGHLIPRRSEVPPFWENKDFHLATTQ